MQVSTFTPSTCLTIKRMTPPAHRKKKHSHIYHHIGSQKAATHDKLNADVLFHCHQSCNNSINMCQFTIYTGLSRSNDVAVISFKHFIDSRITLTRKCTQCQKALIQWCTVQNCRETRNRC